MQLRRKKEPDIFDTVNVSKPRLELVKKPDATKKKIKLVRHPQKSLGQGIVPKIVTAKPEPEKKEPVSGPHATIAEEPDVAIEQKEPPYTTLFCPESIKDIKLIKQSPEDYLEINIIKKSRVVDTFAISIDKHRFHYKKKEYNVVEGGIYLLPTKGGLLMPSSFYREGNPNPTGFKNTNKGITGKALSLLYMEQLYTSLLYGEENKYNLFIVILLIACLIAFGVACYFVFMHGGGMFQQPGQPLPPIP